MRRIAVPSPGGQREIRTQQPLRRNHDGAADDSRGRQVLRRNRQVEHVRLPRGRGSPSLSMPERAQEPAFSPSIVDPPANGFPVIDPVIDPAMARLRS